MLKLFVCAAALLWSSGALALAADDPAPADPLPEDIWGGGCVLYNRDGVPRVRAPTCRLSVHFSLGLVLTSIDLVTYKVRLGSDAAPVGPCYSITYQPKRWYASGLNLCLSVVGGQDVPSTVFPSVIARLLRWGAFGAGPLFTARTNGEPGMSTHWILLTGINVPVQ